MKFYYYLLLNIKRIILKKLIFEILEKKKNTNSNLSLLNDPACQKSRSSSFSQKRW